MTVQLDSGEDIVLTGKSGQQYKGKIYADKNASPCITGKAIVCLTNSKQSENGWTHQVNSIYNSDNMQQELKHFNERNDISHLVLLPYIHNDNGVVDKVDDLIRSYIHQ